MLHAFGVDESVDLWYPRVSVLVDGVKSGVDRISSILRQGTEMRSLDVSTCWTQWLSITVCSTNERWDCTLTSIRPNVSESADRKRSEEITLATKWNGTGWKGALSDAMRHRILKQLSTN